MTLEHGFFLRRVGLVTSNPAQILKKPISLIDLAPTFLAAAGLEKADTMHGRKSPPSVGFWRSFWSPFLGLNWARGSC